MYFPIPPPRHDPETFATHLISSSEVAFTANECKRIIALARKSEPQSASVGSLDEDGQNGHKVRFKPDPKIRRAKIHRLPTIEKTSWIYERLCALAQAANARTWGFDLNGVLNPFHVIRYGVGDHYTWHVDAGAAHTSDRKISLTVQLSDGNEYSGGDLELTAGPRPMKVAREQGCIVLFPSFVLHRVRPVKRGVRWALVGWIQGPPFR